MFSNKNNTKHKKNTAQAGGIFYIILSIYIPETTTYCLFAFLAAQPQDFFAVG